FNTQNQKNDRFTQEIRLSRTADNYRWVLGAFYEEKSEYWEYRARTPEFLESLSYAYFTYIYPGTESGVDPSWWLSVDDTEWKQWAVFGNFSYDLTDRLTAEVGMRYFDQEMDRFYYVDKPFLIGQRSSTSPQGGNDDFVPKVTLEYTIDDDKMVYALYSEGFRSGGANRNRTPFTVFPQAYDPDLLKNFEIGAKTRWLDGRLQINATAYIGQWENYQIEAVDPSFRVCQPGEVADVDLCNQPFQVMVANVGDARQTGLELDVRAAPNDIVDLGLNVGFVDAETTEAFEVTTLVPKGSKLPNVPELKISTYAQFTWPVLTSESFYLRGQFTWQDESLNQLEAIAAGAPLEATGAPQYKQSSYGILDFRTGLRSDSWVLEGFISNVFDERATLFNNSLFMDYFWGRQRVVTNRPREFGLRFSYNWQ
ncbi:MAG: TonB-dependent receptor, partial [Gammaproteobacteria bacterium]|nr:TonB-dependent receptor [Gammaproteobacteria bacterium]